MKDTIKGSFGNQKKKRNKKYVPKNIDAMREVSEYKELHSKWKAEKEIEINKVKTYSYELWYDNGFIDWWETKVGRLLLIFTIILIASNWITFLITK